MSFLSLCAGLLLQGLRTAAAYWERLNRLGDRQAGAAQQQATDLAAAVALQKEISQAEANAPSDLQQLAADLRKDGLR